MSTEIQTVKPNYKARDGGSTITRASRRHERPNTQKQGAKGGKKRHPRRGPWHALPIKGEFVRPELEVRVKNGVPFLLRDGGVLFERMVLRKKQCEGNFFNVLVRWSGRPWFAREMPELVGTFGADRLARHWRDEILLSGMSLYELATRSPSWDPRNSYEDFMDSVQAGHLRASIRECLGGCETCADILESLRAASSVMEEAVASYAKECAP